MSDYSNTHWMKDLPDTPMQKCDRKICDIRGCQGFCEGSPLPEYQPETIAIPALELQNIVDALEAGLEHTQTVLAEHDASLGRTTRKNQSWAEHLEKDIEFLKARIKLLKLKIVGATTHYP